MQRPLLQIYTVRSIFGLMFLYSVKEATMRFKCGKFIPYLMLLSSVLHGEIKVEGITSEEQTNGTLISIRLNNHLPDIKSQGGSRRRDGSM